MDGSMRYVGDTFDGRYRINRVIGVGGMAVVYEATDLQTGKRVAIKMLKDSISDNAQALRRFINESKAVAMMNHKNIVRILAVSVKTEHKFIVMEYIKGITLREYMNRKGVMDWREATEFVDQILSALDHAHMKHVVHRDIKPQNIMVMEGGMIKVMDFGIAKIPDAETVTMVDKAIGTIFYISPEQAKSSKIDDRSDIYSLGVMFYEMVTGRLPFMAETSYAIMLKHISDLPTPPTKLCPKLPLGIEQIILCAMEKDPNNRYQSAPQMLRHIRRIKTDPTTIFQRQIPAVRTSTADMAIERTTRDPDRDEYPVRETPRTESAPPQPLRRRRSAGVPFSVVVVICLIFLAVAIGGFVLLWTMLCDMSIPAPLLCNMSTSAPFLCDMSAPASFLCDMGSPASFLCDMGSPALSLCDAAQVTHSISLSALQAPAFLQLPPFLW